MFLHFVNLALVNESIIRYNIILLQIYKKLSKARLQSLQKTFQNGRKNTSFATCPNPPREFIFEKKG